MRKVPFVSIFLVLLAHAAFGTFSHTRYVDALLEPEQQQASLAWISTSVYIVIQSAVLSIGWKPVRNFVLLGFTSDVGYLVMALVGASLVVIVLSWLQTFTYFLVMIAAALLLRVDLLTRGVGNSLAFLILTLVSLGGLGLSYVSSWAGS